MCTLMTVTRAMYDGNVDFIDRVNDDARNNDDGWALMLIDKFGAATLLRTLDLDQVLHSLAGPNWTRMFLHSRMATKGGVSLENTHGWIVKGVAIMHNGVLRGTDTWAHPVDSMAIGTWLLRGGLDCALKNLRDEPWANVFMIDTVNNMYVMSRSSAGSLYTDGAGNYSTRAVAGIGTPVRDDSYELHEWPVERVAPPPLPMYRQWTTKTGGSALTTWDDDAYYEHLAAKWRAAR